ncbi:MAG: multicopper oxidase family protein [Candidatus Thermoplasmatota archaeon]
MKVNAVAVAAFVSLVYLGGCMGAGVSAADAPRVREFEMVVHSALSDTVELYEKNDGTYSKVVAITFKESTDDEQRFPGPEIRVKEGDTVKLRIVNLNGLSHTVHLHGGLIPWDEDGVDHLTQNPIRTGEEQTYTFADLKAGTYWYHCHVDASHHIDFGMYGALIVEEREPTYPVDRDYVIFLDEVDNCHVHGNQDPIQGQEPSVDPTVSIGCYQRFIIDNLAQNRAVTTTANAVPPEVRDATCPALEALPDSPAQAKTAKEQAKAAFGCGGIHEHGTPPPQQSNRTWWPETHPYYNPEYNTFLVNGKAFPDTPVFPVKEGETVRFRIINAGNFVHTWHPHGHTMQVITKDGYPWAGGPQSMDTLSIAPGERYDYIMKMDNPGLWMIHDQMGQFAANDNVHPGGMVACFPYDGFRGAPAFEFTRSLDCNTYAMENILGKHGHSEHS